METTMLAPGERVRVTGFYDYHTLPPDSLGVIVAASVNAPTVAVNGHRIQAVPVAGLERA